MTLTARVSRLNLLYRKIAVKYFGLLLLLLIVSRVDLQAATRYSVNTGNWNSTSTWSASSGGASGASAPVAGDIVYIEGNRTVTITAAAACASVSVASGSTLSVGAYNFTVSVSTSISGTLISTSTTGTKSFAATTVSGGTWTSNAAETHTITSLTTSGATFNGSATGVFTISGSMNVNQGTTATFNAVTITISGTTTIDGTFVLASATGTKTFNGNIIINGTGTWLNSGNEAVTIKGDLENHGTFTSGTGIYTFNGTASQNILGDVSFSMQNLTMNNSLGLTLGGTNNVTINGTLTLTAGKITTGSNILIIGSAGTVSSATSARYVVGNLQKIIAASTASKTFEIGDAVNYAPVTLAFTGTTNSGGSITASTVNTDHPEIASVSIDPNLSVNRYWTLTNSGVSGFTACSPTFTFVAGDLDAGANYTLFKVGRREGGTWTYPAMSTLTATTTRVTGLTAFGDFQIGQCGATLQAISGNSAPCQGSIGNAYSVNQVDGSAYTWTVPSGWSISAGQNTSSVTVTAGTLSGNISVNMVSACGATGSQSMPVSASINPVASANVSSSAICDGSSVALTASATPATQPANLISENFNGATNSWTTENNSTGGTPANAAWTLRADGYNVSSTTFHSNDNSQFYLTNSDSPGNGSTTATILQSPAFNTQDYSAISLSFWHYYRYYNGNESGKVEITTNGSSWTTLVSYTSNQGTATGFVNVNLDLSAYIGYSSVMIRFKYDATYDWWWAIDNVTITGTPVSFAYEYSWSAIPSGTAGLPAGAGTPSAANNSIEASPTANTIYTVTATSAAGCSSEASTSVVVNPVMPVSISISASATTICSGTSVTFTATPVNGGSTPSYQWKINGGNVGSNSATYVTASLSNNDQVSCILTSSITCASGSPATSNVITMTVNPILTAGISIAASSNPICAGTSVTFTATPVNGGSLPSYQWKLNGSNVGSNSTTYVNSSLVNNDVVSCIMTSNAGCITGNPATSNSITMVVGTVFAVGVSISADPGNTVCSGISVTYTAVPVNGGATPAYQWKKNSSNVGSNSSQYTETSPANGDVITCVLTSSLSCTSGNPATSNAVTMTVNLTPSDPTSISASPSSFYSDYTGQITLNSSGGGGTGASLKWYEGGCGTGSSIGTGASLSITPPVSTTTYYSRWENGTCYSACKNAIVTVYTNYRSKTTGDWSLASSWEVNRAGSWFPASGPPSSLDGFIDIVSPHTITISSAGGEIQVDELTIESSAKLLVDVSPANWWFNLVDGPGTDLTINGILEYQDDQLPAASGATIIVGDGGKFQHNLNYAGSYPITIPTASWHSNSTCEILSSNQLDPLAGLNQSFGNFTWNYPGQTADVSLGSSLTSVAGNLNILSTGSGQLKLGSGSALNLSIGNDLILQSGTLDCSSAFSGTNPVSISGNYSQSGGIFKNSGSATATVRFLGAGKTFAQSGGSIDASRINWDVTSAASLTLLNDVPVSTGQSFTLNGSLDCGSSFAITGPGSYQMNNGALLTTGSPYGLTDTPLQGSVQTGSCSIASACDFVFNGADLQQTGNRFPSQARNLTINNSSGVNLNSALTISGTLTLTSGAFWVDSQALAFKNHNIPIVKTGGTIHTSINTDLSFGTSGNTAGAAFALPADLFTSEPVINNLSIYRQNTLTLNNQWLNIRGVVLCNGPLVTNGKLKLLSDQNRTALIDGTGTGSISGTVTMQRYLANGFGYKYVSSPFQSSTVGAFASYIDLGASFPAFYRYDENRNSSGWVDYSEASGSLDVMKGYAANFGSSSDPVTFELNGVVNNNLSSTLTLYNHNKTYTEGFNLVGNPYPSPIDWDAASGWTLTGIDDAVYYFNAGSTDQYSGTYSSYVNGISSDGTANNIIPAMQGFFVHVTDGSYPVTASLGMNNNVRINALSPSFHAASATAQISEVRLKVINEGDEVHADYCVIYHANGGGTGFEKELDALKLQNTDAAVPNIFFNTPSGKLSINALDFEFSGRESIPFDVLVSNTGCVEISPYTISNLPSGLRIYLADSVSGGIREISAGEKYKVCLDAGEHPGRFSLVFSYENLGGKHDTGDVFTIHKDGEKIHIFLELKEGTNAGFMLSNMMGQVILKDELTGSGEHIIEGKFVPGVYIATVQTANGIYSKKIYLGQ